MTMTRARVFLLVFVCALTVTTAAGGQSLLSRATDLGPVSATNQIEITLWMKLHDQQGLDSLVAAQQSGKAAFLSFEQVRAQHAPSHGEAAKVADLLTADGFTVSSIGHDNLFVKATGSAGLVQSTFHVELHEYDLSGRTFRASSRSATLPPALGGLVAAVGGLSNLAPEPQIARTGVKGGTSVHRPSEAEGVVPQPLRLSAAPNGLVFSEQCFYPPTSVNFTSTDGTVTASYHGNGYGAPVTNTAAGTLPPCGYQPSEIQTAYKLTPLYREGLTGAGTTVAIVDAYGSTTIGQDLAAFSQNMGLPAANLSILGTPTESNFSTDANAGWASETTLDVEWVHAIAPGAKIVLVVAPTNSFNDLFAADIAAASIPGVVSISNSWSSLEIGIAGEAAFYRAIDNVFKAIGAAGESIQFSTGDYGNNASLTGGLFTSTGWPASSPYVTGIGGVSVALDSEKHIAWQTSWGNNITEVADTAALGNPPIDPPLNEGFVFGGTGGASDVYPKPSYQADLRGNRRLTPDISWVADPYTGVEIIYTGDAQGDLFIDVIGGTSAACPMFSALWSIANQHARHRLGQAAPLLYRLPSNAITDVVNSSSRNNVTGTIQDPGGTSPVNSWELAAPLNGLPTFFSALYNSPYSTRWFVLTFGVDSTLATGEGWDPATGLGTPNGWNFVHAFDGSADSSRLGVN
jgi:subtilase family serine protease